VAFGGEVDFACKKTSKMVGDVFIPHLNITLFVEVIKDAYEIPFFVASAINMVNLYCGNKY